MNGHTPANGLRAWARGAYDLEAAVEILLRAFDGRFARPGLPWIVGHDPDEHAFAWGLDVDAPTTAAAEGPYSGGERRMLAIVASLAGGRPVNLADAVTGVDRANAALVLAGIAHANGSHEHSAIRIDPDTGRPSFTRRPSLYPWPHADTDEATRVAIGEVAAGTSAVPGRGLEPAQDEHGAGLQDADAADGLEDGAPWT